MGRLMEMKVGGGEGKRYGIVHSPPNQFPSLTDILFQSCASRMEARVEESISLLDLMVSRNMPACRLGSRRKRQPICCVLEGITPAPQKFSGFGSTPSRTPTPKPWILLRIWSVSIDPIACTGKIVDTFITQWIVVLSSLWINKRF